MPKNIFIIAGEPSGDSHASKLVRAIHQIDPTIRFFGTGGDGLKAAGVHLYYHINQLSFMGLTEVVRHLWFIRVVMATLVKAVAQEKPDLVILVDYPGFNMRLARILKKVSATPIVYYVAPQVWAWGQGRLKQIARFIDHLIVILPFEKGFFAGHGITADYFGHPLIASARPSFTKEHFFQKFNVATKHHIVGLLPGSRLQEVQKILPVMLKSAGLIDKREKIHVLIAVAPGIKLEPFDHLLKKAPFPYSVCPNLPYDVMKYSDLVLTASGTATLETAYIGTPMIILYKVSFLTWFFGRLLIKIPFIGLVNVVMHKPVVPEFIQFSMQPALIARAALGLFDDTHRYQHMVQELSRVRDLLGTGNPSQLAAEKIVSILT